MKLFFFTLSLLFLFYLFLPSPGFPRPPSDALQSNEPADTEMSLRRAYFTNYTRKEVMNHYSREFRWGYGLNYPPEESGKIIRDQTRSTFLEEIVHPFRESIYINGFEPKAAKDAIVIGGLPWRQKIIVKQVQSPYFARVLVGMATVVLIWLIYQLS